MAKVFGIHMIGLRPGVKGEDFERFFREKVSPLPRLSGMKVYLLKGDRGDREGKYLVMLEQEIETRDRLFPLNAPPSAEMQQFFDTHQGVFAEWDKLASPIGAPTIFTDYVVVAEW